MEGANVIKKAIAESGLYPYFFHHPGQIHELSDVRVSQATYMYIYWFQLCIVFIRILLVDFNV